MKRIISLCFGLALLCGCGGGSGTVATSQAVAEIKPAYGYRENIPVRDEWVTLFERLDVPAPVTVSGVISLYNYPCLLQFLVDGEVKQQVEMTNFYRFNLRLAPGRFEIRVKSMNQVSYIKPCETYMLVDFGSEPR